MKVVLVHDFHSEDVPSGENEVVKAEAAALRRAGVEVMEATVRNDELNRRPLHGLQAAVTVASGRGRSPLRQLGDFEPDVIHVHNLFPYFGHTWLRHSPAPVVATVHSYRMVCANGYLFRDGEVCTLCPDGRPWSGVRWGCYRGSRAATVPLAWAARRGAARDPLVAAASRLLVLSERAAAVLSQAGVPAEKIGRDWHFVPDDLDPGMGAERDDAWLFVGRLSAEKGIDRLLTEWPAGLRLRVVGEGSIRPALERSARGKQVEFLGRLPRSAVVAEMQRSRGLVFPSRWYETFGLAYIEALAAGLPTVAFEPNVVADAVRRDRTGVVASWEALEPALAEAAETFDALRPRCRAVFAELYSERAFATRRIELYDEVTRAARRGVL